MICNQIWAVGSECYEYMFVFQATESTNKNQSDIHCVQIAWVIYVIVSTILSLNYKFHYHFKPWTRNCQYHSILILYLSYTRYLNVIEQRKIK